MTQVSGFVRMNDVEIPLETTRRKGQRRREQSFYWEGCRYYLSDFIRVNNSRNCGYKFPCFIHAVEADNDSCPLMIEIIEGFAVNIYTFSTVW